MRSNRLSFCLALVGQLVFASLLLAQGTTPTKTDIPTVIGQIVEARELTASYVGIANTRFKDDAKNLQQAQELYAAAYSKYSGWNAQVAAAIRAGKSKNLVADPNYKTTAKDASTAANAFIAFVKAPTTAESREVITILSSLADLGLKLWAGVRKQVDSDREQTAKNFETATKWQKWDDIAKGNAGHAETAPATKP